jgi:transposase-like protein
MEVIISVERRWPEDQLRILAELKERGATIAGVVRQHELSSGLLQ